MLNAFEMPVAGPVGAQHAAPLHHAYYLLDLPGYGYSRASRTDRAVFRGLITHTLERPRLAGVLWLLDIRRDPSDDDRAMQPRSRRATCWAGPHGHAAKQRYKAPSSSRTTR